MADEVKTWLSDIQQAINEINDFLSATASVPLVARGQVADMLLHLGFGTGEETNRIPQ